ncbi:hypothetical protein GCM10023189_12070 [Nibrella saemangeumensis]|uniref:Outer membrane protein beta-barrel domain-containing protein n=1 Tax=Nibrella saemangeumensis TaxID=1084526 RepID=A0ABP8MJW2_9BACT
MKQAYAILLISLSVSLGACTSIRKRSDIFSLNQVYLVGGRQTVYAQDRNGTVQPKELSRPAKAALYERNDTLFAEFVTAALPLPDQNPRTLDQSDSLAVLLVHYHARPNGIDEKSPWFRYHLTSFDIDLFTVPFKYRFGQQGNPGELTTTPNLGLYTGIRYDLGRHRSVYFRRERRSEIQSFSFGAGGFVSMDPVRVYDYNTGAQVSSEYEALGVNYGVAAILGYRAITAGLALGFENLADRNNRFWMYRNKPWLGLTVGLNIN